jgi:hypothetical protein
VELASAADLYQAGGFQFLDVRGEGCGRNEQGSECFYATQRTASLRYSLE